jgi:sterol 3beta-glucosyltransferase
MHVVMATTGTQGDVQPFVAIGLGLQRAGHRVTLVANPDHEPFVASRGLAFRAAGGSMRAVLESDAGREWLESGDSPRRYFRTLKRAFEPTYAPYLRDMHEALLDADAVLYQPFVFGAQFTADLRGIPAVCLSPFPNALSAEMEPLGWPGAPSWRWLRRGLQRAFLGALWSLTRESHVAHRAAIGLGPLRTSNPLIEILERVPLLQLYSPSLVPVPGDWGEHVHATGFCFLDAAQGWTPPPELVRFLSSGPPPIYVGFGSMTGHHPEALASVAIEAVSWAKQRAILVSGWSGMAGGTSVPENVHVTDSVPHDWLFPRVSAVVHHGGAGTTAAGLRAGKPTLIAAFFGDQPFWGRRVAGASAGPEPILRKDIDAIRLAAGITRLVSDESYRLGAERVAEALRQEDGVANAVATVERYVGRSSSIAQPLAREREPAGIGF